MAQCYPAQSDGDVPRALACLFGDDQFLRGVDAFSTAWSRWGVPVSRYRLEGLAGPGLLAATHGEEIPFVFGAPYLKLFGSQQSPTDGDAASRARDAEARQRLSQALSTAWTAFAAKGFQTMRPCQHGRATRPANRSWRSGEASPPSLHRR